MLSLESLQIKGVATLLVVLTGMKARLSLRMPNEGVTQVSQAGQWVVSRCKARLEVTPHPTWCIQMSRKCREQQDTQPMLNRCNGIVVDAPAEGGGHAQCRGRVLVCKPGAIFKFNNDGADTYSCIQQQDQTDSLGKAYKYFLATYPSSAAPHTHGYSAATGWLLDHQAAQMLVLAAEETSPWGVL